MPTPDELFPDGDPADWPMCRGTFDVIHVPYPGQLTKRTTARCVVCGVEHVAIRVAAGARINFHTAPRRYAAWED